MTQTTDAALVDQIRCSATYGYMPMAVRRHLCQAADTIEAQARRIEECADLLAAIVNADPGPKADAAFAAARAWYAAYDALEPTP